MKIEPSSLATPTRLPTFDCAPVAVNESRTARRGLRLARLSDQELIARTKHLAARECEATAELVASIAEIEQRRLYLAEGYSSLFVYCVQVLHLSEEATCNRITAARASLRFPLVLERLSEGSVTLTAVRRLAPHLTEENHKTVLDEARWASTNKIEEMLARLSPQPDVPSMVRKLPQPKTAQLLTGLVGTGHAQHLEPRLTSGVPPAVAEDRAPVSVAVPSSVATAAPLMEPPAFVAFKHAPAVASAQPAAAPVSAAPASHRPLVAPIAPGRYKVQMTVGAETYAKLRKAQDLLRHSIPNGDIAKIFDRALTLLVEETERRQHAQAKRPHKTKKKTSRAKSRHIPAEVKREVWQRDEGRCSFVGRDGKRCGGTGFLQYHHREPYAEGGEATAGNTALRCGRHNRHEAEQHFGFTREPVPERGREKQRAIDQRGAVETRSGTGKHPS
jgi:5-methylcytosine-specific restriction endonuclease McrA